MGHKKNQEKNSYLQLQQRLDKSPQSAPSSKALFEILQVLFTEEEARSVWSSQSWSGKSGSDPFVNRGGYRCRHSFIPFDPEWEDLLED